MTILFAASELAPLASTGGLGEVAACLPRFVAARGHDTALALPGYPALVRNAVPLDVNFEVRLGDDLLPASVYERTLEDGTQLLLICNDALFARAGVYADPRTHVEYEDNARRYLFFSKAVVELARRLDPSPSVLHVHDWQTALIPVLIRESRLPIRTVLTLHNLSFQGVFCAETFALTNLPSGWMTPGALEFHGRMNLLKGGILAADALTTVSARYRREILSTEAGCGLEGVLNHRVADLESVPLGVDPVRWTPSSEEAGRLLPARFSAEDLSGKNACRKALITETGLLPEPSGPIFTMFGRLADQKGLDLLLPLVPRLLSANNRLVIAGDGDPKLHRELLLACRRHPGKFAFVHEWEPGFPQRLLAGSDVLLMPSHFEPGGLAPLHALAYGTVPVAHATGGLADNLTHFELRNSAGNSLLYYEDSQAALWDSILRACLLFEQPAVWKKLVQNAIQSRFPWELTADKLEAIYQRISR
jgi:starch synthase